MGVKTTLKNTVITLALEKIMHAKIMLETGYIFIILIMYNS